MQCSWVPLIMDDTVDKASTQLPNSVIPDGEHCATNLRDTTVVRGPSWAGQQTYFGHQVLLLIAIANPLAIVYL